MGVSPNHNYASIDVLVLSKMKGYSRKEKYFVEANKYLARKFRGTLDRVPHALQMRLRVLNVLEIVVYEDL